MMDVPEFGLAARVLLALLFAGAAIGKMRHWIIFQGVVANYRLLPAWLVAPFATLLPPVEVLLAAALLSGLARPWPELAAAGLLGLFAVAMAINLRRGRSYIDCGCFQGALKQTLRWVLVARNGGLVLVCGLATMGGPADLARMAQGLLAGVVLFLLLQSLNLFWSIVPAWRRTPAHHQG